MRQADFPGHQSERRTCVSFPTPRFIAGCLIFGILPAMSAAQDTPLTGIWHHAGSKAELGQRHEAIDQATQAMGVFMRGRAREHLRKVTKPPQELTLTEEKDQLTFSTNGRPLTMTIDGSPTRVVQRTRRGDNTGETSGGKVSYDRRS